MSERSSPFGPGSFFAFGYLFKYQALLDSGVTIQVESMTTSTSINFSAEDANTWLPLVKHVIRVTFPIGFRPPVERCEVEQECLTRIPQIITDYSGKKGARLDSFVRGAVKNDALDYLRRIGRESCCHSIAESFRHGGGKFLDQNGRRTGTTPIAMVTDGGGEPQPDSPVGWWIASIPSESISEEHLERVKGALTTEQYRVYQCRFVLGMTQEATAGYLHTTREAVASRQRKLAANLLKAGMPVPNRSA